MEKRRYGNIKEDISLLGFGLMRLPRKDENTQDIDYDLAEKMIDYAIKNGVNYFDTAWPYHDGMSETFVGDVLSKYDRKSYNLASKCPVWAVKKESDVLNIFNKQLKKCKVEYFDFYLLHALSKDTFEKVKKLHIYETLKKLKEEGKIRYLGFSFHDRPTVLKHIRDTYQFDFAQIQLNYVDWEEYQSDKQYSILREKNIPVIVMEPVRGGSLASLNDKAREILNNHDNTKSIASWALRYAASKDGILTVLSGMSDLNQVEDNINTFNNFVQLKNTDLKVIEEAKKAYREADTILCTACRYCMPCPYSVNIPKTFKIYNDYRINHDAKAFLNAYNNELEDKEKPNNCVRCNACVSKCPQSLKIPELLRKIVEIVERLTE